MSRARSSRLVWETWLLYRQQPPWTDHADALRQGLRAPCMLGEQVNRGSMPAVQKILKPLESLGHFPLLIEMWKIGEMFL